MQTNFSLAQLADPDIAVADSVLRACVHCGFCTATCPTYVLLGDEADSPRGRIYLIKEMLESGKPASPQVAKHLDRCLSCLSCMTTCPSGVHYMHLVDIGRERVEATYRRPLGERLFRRLLTAVLPYPKRFRLALRAAGLARPFAAIAPKRFKPLFALAPRSVPPAWAGDRPQTFASEGARRGRVALLAGCAQQVLSPDINAATVRLLTRHGWDVTLAEGAGCCGALEHHLGKTDRALDRVRANVDAWTREIDSAGLEAIVVNTSGCGTTVKDYGHMLRTDPAYADKAARVSALTRDVTELLAPGDLREATPPEALTVAYHSACSMQHGQKIKTEPRALLEAAGFAVAEPGEAHLCCGSAGTYNILQPELATRLRDRKVGEIEKLGPDLIAAGNIGCMMQIGGGTSLPVVHTAQLLDWATGGPRPPAL